MICYLMCIYCIYIHTHTHTHYFQHQSEHYPLFCLCEINLCKTLLTGFNVLLYEYLNCILNVQGNVAFLLDAHADVCFLKLDLLYNHMFHMCASVLIGQHTLDNWLYLYNVWKVLWCNEIWKTLCLFLLFCMSFKCF